jgi:hypothetical protein
MVIHTMTPDRIRGRISSMGLDGSSEDAARFEDLVNMHNFPALAANTRDVCDLTPRVPLSPHFLSSTQSIGSIDTSSSIAVAEATLLALPLFSLRASLLHLIFLGLRFGDRNYSSEIMSHTSLDLALSSCTHKTGNIVAPHSVPGYPPGNHLFGTDLDLDPQDTTFLSHSV